MSWGWESTGLRWKIWETEYERHHREREGYHSYYRRHNVLKREVSLILVAVFFPVVLPVVVVANVLDITKKAYGYVGGYVRDYLYYRRIAKSLESVENATAAANPTTKVADSLAEPTRVLVNAYRKRPNQEIAELNKQIVEKGSNGIPVIDWLEKPDFFVSGSSMRITEGGKEQQGPVRT